MAIKTLLDAVEDPSAERRLLQEARALETCRSPNVVEVLDAGVSEGRPYVVLEMLEGKGLDGLLTARRALSLADASAVAVDVLAALSVVHANGLVHRDVKPANVIVARGERGDRVKLIDFGVAHVPASSSDPALTQAGERLGTIVYMAPEQLLGEVVGPAADLYGVAVLLYEAITGALPYPGGPQEMLKRHASQVPVPTLSLLAPAAAPLDGVVRRALSFDPEARFRTAGEMSAAIESALGSIPRARAILDPKLAASASQRRTPRAPYVTPVRVVTPDAIIDGHTADLSMGGLLVTLRAAVPPSPTLEARFCLPMSGRVMALPVELRWQREAHGRHVVGLRFRDLGAEARRDVERFVALAGAPP